MKTPSVSRALQQTKIYDDTDSIWGILVQTSATQEMKHWFSYSAPKQEIWSSIKKKKSNVADEISAHVNNIFYWRDTI